MTALAFPLEPLRLRCGHKETVALPFLGESEVRCWRPAYDGGDLCRRHDMKRAVLRARERIDTRLRGPRA